MATDRKTETALQQLGETLAVVADGVTQLQLDVAKIEARVAAIDSEVASIRRRLDHDGVRDTTDNGQRDLELEQAVFGRKSGTAIAERAGEKRKGATGSSPKPKQQTRKPPAKRKR